MKNEAELVDALTLSSEQAPSTQSQAEKEGLEEWVDKPIVAPVLPVLKPLPSARLPMKTLVTTAKPRSLAAYRVNPVSLAFQLPRQPRRVYFYGKHRDLQFNALFQPPKQTSVWRSPRPVTGAAPQRSPRSFRLSYLLP